MNDNNPATSAVRWWAWLAAVFAGAFLVNAIPHSVMGLTGQAFPSPFSGGPPNLSSSTVNVLWGAFNVAVGFWLMSVIWKWRGNRLLMAVVAAAGLAFALMLASVFQVVWDTPAV